MSRKDRSSPGRDPNSGEPCPMAAQVALQRGGVVADNLVARWTGGRTVPPPGTGGGQQLGEAPGHRVARSGMDWPPPSHRTVGLTPQARNRTEALGAPVAGKPPLGASRIRPPPSWHLDVQASVGIHAHGKRLERTNHREGSTRPIRTSNRAPCHVHVTTPSSTSPPASARSSWV